jgi:hypothetical protein
MARMLADGSARAAVRSIGMIERSVAWSLVVAGALAGCQRVDRSRSVESAARQDTPPAVAAPLPPLVPLAPEPLAWGLTEDEAVARLARAGMAPQSDEIHGYFSTPEQFHAAPGTIEVAHTIEPVILFVPRPGWTGTVHYPSPGAPMDRVELAAQLTRDGALAELRALERRFGPPDDRVTYPADAPAVAGSTRLAWVRGGVWLIAFAGSTGGLSVAYRRDDRPLSELRH